MDIKNWLEYMLERAKKQEKLLEDRMKNTNDSINDVKELIRECNDTKNKATDHEKRMARLMLGYVEIDYTDLVFAKAYASRTIMDIQAILYEMKKSSS